MNPKLQKINEEIDRLKGKITAYQGRVRELERQKTELENADIIALVRGVDIPPDEFAAFVNMFREQRQTAAVPDLPAIAAGDTPSENKSEQEESLEKK